LIKRLREEALEKDRSHRQSSCVHCYLADDCNHL
jgi:hypothetical protein